MRTSVNDAYNQPTPIRDVIRALYRVVAEDDIAHVAHTTTPITEQVPENTD